VTLPVPVGQRAWRPGSLRATVRAAALSLLGAAMVLVCGSVTVAAPVLLRLCFYLTIVMVLAAITLMRPRAGVVATMGFLFILALLRRVLIDSAGWSSLDPLLLVGPTIVAVLAVQLFVIQRRPVAPDRLSVLVLLVLGLSIVEIANPTGASVGANVAALLFVAVPLAWFFVGRELAEARLTNALLMLLLVLSVAIGAYGLWQTQVGLPSWDRSWVDINGYSSLNIGDRIRSFGTFSSSAEYALFLASGLAVAVAFMLQGKPEAVLAVPPLALALFFASARGALISGVVAVVVVAALRTRKAVAGAMVMIAGLVVTGALLFALGGSLGGSANSLVAHQAGGLADPLDPSSSTLGVHAKLVVDGLLYSIHHPLGGGTGAANIGGTDNSVRGTEIDVTNAFINLGVLGGLLYAVTVGTALLLAVRGYLSGSSALLPITGVLIAGLGQWLTGGHYALSPFTWLLIGAVAAAAGSAARDRWR
jgi:hypothetical protein